MLGREQFCHERLQPRADQLAAVLRFLKHSLSAAIVTGCPIYRERHYERIYGKFSWRLRSLSENPTP